MATTLRRLLLVWLFMFWQGGFLFYGTVVVTIGSAVVGSDFGQGLITRRVAIALNVTGVAVLLVWIWDLVAERATRLRQRWAAWAFLMLTLAVLALVHPQMDRLIDADRRVLIDADAFHALHRWYLRVSTAQWLGSIVFIFWTLQNWRATDAASVRS